jgi:hypothetical protein
MMRRAPIAWPAARCVCALGAALLLAGMRHAAGATNAPDVSAPAHFTSAWALVRTRPLPLTAADATPLIIANDDDEQLWIADQRRHEVSAYTRGRRRTQRVSVPARGVITSVYFGDDQRILFALQRGTMSYPLGDLRVHTGEHLLSKNYGLLYNRTYPNYWDSSKLSAMMASARERGEYCAVSPPTVIVPRTACISRRGTVYIAVPLLSIIERYAANGKTYSAFTLDSVRPLVPCSLIITRAEELILADALRNRVIVMDSRARVKTVIPCQDATRVFLAPHYKRGWLMLDTAADELSLYTDEGRRLHGWPTRGMQVAAALLPARNMLWLFVPQQWSWYEYEPARR